MKPLFYVCCFTLLFIYYGMSELRDVSVVQSSLGPMDIFLALAVPIGFSQSITSAVKKSRFRFKDVVWSLGFLLVFTLNQILHGIVGGVSSNALAMAQGPPIEKEIAQLVDQALFNHQVDHRAKGATLLYIVSGVKTIYKSKNNQYEVFTPSQEEREERKKWKSSDTKVDALRAKIFDQVIAITNCLIFHIASFFVLFSATMLYEVRPAKKITP